MPEVRLCDKDAEIERIKQYCSARGCKHKYWSIHCKACEVSDMIDEFESAQEVKADPVRRGRWAIAAGKQYCTNCRAVTKVNNAPFCWHCGAQMDLRTPTEAALDMGDSVMMGGDDNG